MFDYFRPVIFCLYYGVKSEIVPYTHDIRVTEQFLLRVCEFVFSQHPICEIFSKCRNLRIICRVDDSHHKLTIKNIPRTPQKPLNGYIYLACHKLYLCLTAGDLRFSDAAHCYVVSFTLFSF